MRLLATRVFVLSGMMMPAACGAAPSAPSEQGRLRLTVEPLQTFAGSASVAEFALKLQNTDATPVAITFPSSCQVMPYVVERASGRIVEPSGGGWACATVITHLTLGPGETHTETAHVMAGTAPRSPYIVVAAGDYAIYARLEDSMFKLQSGSVSFTVR
jgi:intracellular proteinase inhibitor BsuPI